MAIPLRVHKAATNDDTAGNGGRMSAVQSVSGAVNNLFPRTTVAERTAGNIRFRKAFYKMHDANSIDFFNAHVIPFMGTPALDYVTYFAGTHIDIQSDVSGGVLGEDHYGAGELANPVSNGATQLVVNMPTDSPVIFRNGDLIYVSDEVAWGGAGNSEYLTIDTVGFVGPVATIDLVGSTVNGYAAGGATRVSSVFEHSGTLQSSAAEDASSVAGSGAINYGDPAFIVNHIGGIYQEWTLTWTNATDFDCVGDEVGAVGSGTTGAGITPNNPDYASPYFTLPASAFSGTFQAADWIRFITTPAAIPIWQYHVVPAGIASVVGNNFWAAFVGEGEE